MGAYLHTEEGPMLSYNQYKIFRIVANVYEPLYSIGWSLFSNVYGFRLNTVTDDKE